MSDPFRGSIEPSQRTILEAVHVVQDLVDRRPDPLTEAQVAKAVADGVREAVADPEMWSAAYTAMHERAQREAGGWLLGGIRALASRVAWAAVVLASIYMLGGWSGLIAFMKSGGRP